MDSMDGMLIHWLSIFSSHQPPATHPLLDGLHRWTSAGWLWQPSLNSLEHLTWGVVKKKYPKAAASTTMYNSTLHTSLVTVLIFFQYQGAGESFQNHLVVSVYYGGTLKKLWFIMDNPIKRGWFLRVPILGNLHHWGLFQHAMLARG